MVIWLLLLCFSEEKTNFISLDRLFLENKRAQLGEILPQDGRIKVNLTPLLYDRGTLSRQQVLMAFDKLQHRFIITEAQVTNSQSDTNYAWLEVFLSVTLEEKESGLIYYATFVFNYKIIGSRIAISRWYLQDFH